VSEKKTNSYRQPAGNPNVRDPSAFVRPYATGDRASVFRIAADTAFFGRPVETFMDDRRLQQDIFVAYYVDCEPEYAWVAESAGAVVGYITASPGGARAARDRRKAALRAVARLLTFRYRVGRLTLRYATRAAAAVLRGEYPQVDLRDYPAELHINLAESARGLGLGRRLLETCLQQMTELGSPGIHLSTTNMNGAAIRLYEKLGFSLLGRRHTRLWEPWLPGVSVENLTYGRRLSRQPTPMTEKTADDILTESASR
jgi:ribosomal protein S18 acetylase RimI-like enzyme